MTTLASQITSLAIVYSIAYSDADQRKHQSPASLAFVRGIHRGPVNSPHKGPVTRKMFPFDDVIMRMSQLRTMVLSICVKWSMMCIITIIGAALVVARHREFSFVDYQDENGHSIVDLNNMWLLKFLNCYTTWFLASLIITKHDFNTKSLTLWARRNG